MNTHDEKWEDRINALLDGELSADDADLLKAQAADDRDLAQAIVEAYQLQQAMDSIRVERAPASLSKRLKAIPREHGRTGSLGHWASMLLQPRWAMALAAVPLAIITISLMQPDKPSPGEIAKARQEVAIAFAYLDKAGLITGREIDSVVARTTAEAVTDSVNRTIKSQHFTPTEKNS